MPSPRTDARLADLCAQLAAGRSMKAICRQPGHPHPTTVRAWRKADPAIAARFDAALAAQSIAREAARPTAFDPGLFAQICARLETGEPLRDILRTPGMPSKDRLRAWRRQHAHVDQALEQRVVRHHRRKPAPAPPYDEQAADAFLLRVAKGELVRDLWKDPTTPSRRTWRAWTQQHPELKAAMRGAARHALRRREFATRKLTPALSAEICRRMYEDGLSLNQIGRQPDMPNLGTINYWQRDMPDFERAIASAREMLRDRLMDEVMLIAEAATGATASADRLKIAALKWRIGRLEARLPRRQR